MQTSTPIEAHDADAPRSEDPFRDLSTPELLGAWALFTLVATIVFGLIGDTRHYYVLSLAVVATISTRRWLSRRFRGWSPFGAMCAYMAGVIAFGVVGMAILRALGR